MPPSAILVVGEDYHLTAGICDTLELAGYKPRIAPDPIQGKTIAREYADVNLFLFKPFDPQTLLHGVANLLRHRP